MHKLKLSHRQIVSFLILLCITIQNGSAQTLGVGFCAVFTHTRQKVRMINSKDDFQNTAYAFNLSYEQILNKKSSLQLSYLSYPGDIWMKFREGSIIRYDNQATLGIGFNGATVSNITTNYLYNIIPRSSRCYLKPFLGLTYQFTKPNNWGFYDIEPPHGPDYVQTAPMRTEAFRTFHVLPSLGVNMGFVFWKRLELGLDIQGVYGFKPIQRLYFTYSYKGVPQGTAIFETTGTGIFSTIKVGYRLVKLKE